MKWPIFSLQPTVGAVHAPAAASITGRRMGTVAHRDAAIRGPRAFSFPGGYVSPLMFRCTMTAACVAAVSTSGAAQTPTQPEASVATQVPSRAAPTIMARAIDPDLAFRPVKQEVAPSVVQGRGTSRPVVLMIVGGALLVTGILVGDDAAPILILAGAGIGGYGLYLHLQNPNVRLRR